MPVTLPYAFTGGTKAYSSQVMADLLAITAKFTEGAGGIADADVSTSAGIKGTKLSNVAGSRIPTDRLEDDAVDATKLRDDASTDGNRAVTSNHIRDAAVIAAKIAGSAVIAAKIKVTTQVQALSFAVAASGAALVDQTEHTEVITASPALPLIGTIVPLSVTLESAFNDSVAIKVSNIGLIRFNVKVTRAAAGFTYTGNLTFRYVPVS